MLECVTRKENPRPQINISVNSSSCNFTITKRDIGNFIRQARLHIESVTEQCQNATITCNTSHVQATRQLKVVRNHYIQPNNTLMSSAPTTLSTLTSSPGRGASTAYNDSLILAGILATVYICCERFLPLL